MREAVLTVPAYWVQKVDDNLARLISQVEDLQRDNRLLLDYLEVSFVDVPAKRIVRPTKGSTQE